MATFKDITDDSSIPLDLAKEVERLRVQVYMSEMGTGVPMDSPAALSESIAAGFTSPQDFQVREDVINYPNGDVYKGEMLGPLRHGRGDHSCSSGDRYVGAWRYDKREGRGRLLLASGVSYDGDWLQDKAEGTGACVYEDGARYEGDWKADQREGWGLHVFRGGARYEGEWAADKMDGQGVMTFEDGSTFEGEWHSGERVKGKLAARDGSWEYTGAWKGEVQHGAGVMYRRGLFKYMGEWVAGEQSGEGKCLYADGGVYTGEWKAGMRHGKGSYLFSGSKYDGHWVEDLQDGPGMATTEAGDRYIGHFKAGKRHGKGRCVYADGAKYEGDWAEGVRCGTGLCLYPTGDKYQGAWHGDKRHGRGTCKFADGTRFRGEWEDDAWVQSEAAPARCRVAGPGVTHAVSGDESSLVIQARDEDGNRRLEGGDDFSAALYSPLAVVVADVKDLCDGTYTVCYTPTLAGLYELHLTCGDEHVADSPYPLRVAPGPASLRRCEVEGPGRGAAVAGQEARFAVLLHDPAGNRCEGGAALRALPLEAELLGPDGATHAVEVVPDPGAARYDCVYCAPAPGLYRLHLASAGRTLPRSPFSVRCVPSGQGAEEGGAGDGVPTPALPDLAQRWEGIARAAYAADGDEAGWDSDDGAAAHKTPEDEYIKAHPDVPVVENLEDIWQVSKLQAERKKQEETKKQEIQSSLGAAFGEGQRLSTDEMRAAVQEIVEKDGMAAAKAPATPSAGVEARLRDRPGKDRATRAALQAAAASLDDLN